MKGSYWDSWSAFCLRHCVQPFEGDLLDNSCYSWIRKYGAKELELCESGAKKSIVVDNLRRLQNSRPSTNDPSVILHPFQDMEVDYEPVNLMR